MPGRVKQRPTALGLPREDQVGEIPGRQGAQGSGILLSMSRANGLIVIPDEGGEFKAGSTVKVQLLGRQEKGLATPSY